MTQKPAAWLSMQLCVDFVLFKLKLWRQFIYQLQTDSDAADGSFPKIPEVLFPTLKS